MLFLSNFSKLLFIVNKKYSSLIFFIFMIIFSGVLDLGSLSVVLPFFETIFGQGEMVSLKSDKYFLNYITNMFSDNLLKNFSFFLIFIFFLKMIVSIFINGYITAFVFKNIANLQVKLLRSYLQLEYSQFLKDIPSTYVRNIREFSTQCLQALQAYLTIISEIVILSIIMVYLLFIDFASVISILLIFSLLGVFYSSFFRPMLIKFGERRINAIKIVYKIITESISGFREINLLKKNNFFLKIIKEKSYQIYKNEVKASVISFSPRYLIEFIIIFLIIAYFYFSFNSGQKVEDILPIVGVFGLASIRILPGVSSIIHNTTIINFISPIIDEIFSILKKNSFQNNKEQIHKNDKLINFETIEFKNLNFKYEKSKSKILNDFNFKINKGELVALFGETGKGKSTFLDVFLGFHKNFTGEIFINNNSIDTEQYKGMLQGNASYIPQKPFFLNDSILRNITLENNDNLIDEIKLNKILNCCLINEMFKKNKINLSTILGEEGVQLSGGEMQKINLARGLYNSKQLLILDEATNNLDEKSETEIILNLKKYNSDMLIILVTHNKNNFKFCSKVINF